MSTESQSMNYTLDSKVIQTPYVYIICYYVWILNAVQNKYELNLWLYLLKFLTLLIFPTGSKGSKSSRNTCTWWTKCAQSTWGSSYLDQSGRPFFWRAQSPALDGSNNGLCAIPGATRRISIYTTGFSMYYLVKQYQCAVHFYSRLILIFFG